MPDILIRNLNAETTRRLRARASANGRSLQAEVKEIVEHAHERSFEDLRKVLENFSKRLTGGKVANTGKLIRQDRKR